MPTRSAATFTRSSRSDARLKRGYADTPLGQIHYREAGAGPPLVLLHMTASSSAMWERVMPLFAEHVRAVAMDTPGFGMSDPPPSGRDRLIEHDAQALVALLDALEIERADVVGHHTGATIAIEAATTRPERIGRLVLSGVLALRPDQAAERDEWLRLVATPWRPDGRGDFLRAIVDFLRLYVDEDDGEYFRQELIAKLQAGGDYWQAPWAVYHYDAFDRAARLTQPTLCLTGERDALAETTRRVHAAIPGSAFAQLPGGDGLPVLDPAAYARAVLAFLDPVS